jgi:hypothetical protein
MTREKATSTLTQWAKLQGFTQEDIPKKGLKNKKKNRRTRVFT